MLKTLTNSYEQIRSFANKNEVRVNEVIKIRKNEVTTSFLIHEKEFGIHGKEIMNFVRILELFQVKPLQSALCFQNNVCDM